MTARTILLEVGSGNDWHGGDYTKAAVRAVTDAIHHSSLVFLRTLEVDPNRMYVDVTIGVQRPEKVDATVVKETLPHGQIAVNVVHGGLDVANSGLTDLTVIATAAITVRFDLEEHLARS
ncbi:MAG: hypothetical protein EPN45_16140 [Rhizobiaceae bacterium]|nr:MAG: hypothetical protein EPN45_16140 [Rhizobiaceae bacterium]